MHIKKFREKLTHLRPTTIEFSGVAERFLSSCTNFTDTLHIISHDRELQANTNLDEKEIYRVMGIIYSDCIFGNDWVSIAKIKQFLYDFNVDLFNKYMQQYNEVVNLSNEFNEFCGHLLDRMLRI